MQYSNICGIVGKEKDNIVSKESLYDSARTILGGMISGFIVYAFVTLGHLGYNILLFIILTGIIIFLFAMILHPSK